MSRQSEPNPARGLPRVVAVFPVESKEEVRSRYRRPAGFDIPSSFARPFALYLMREALKDWREAERRYRDAERRSDAFEAERSDVPEAELDEWARWRDAAMEGMFLAEHHFVALLFLNAGRINRYEDYSDRDEIMGDDWKPFALALDGLHIVLTPQGGGISYPLIHIIEGTDFDSSDFGRGGDLGDFENGCGGTVAKPVRSPGGDG